MFVDFVHINSGYFFLAVIKNYVEWNGLVCIKKYWKSQNVFAFTGKVLLLHIKSTKFNET